MMAVFTVGADERRISQMREIAEAWGFVGNYSDSKRLLDDAKKKKIAYVLVVDPEAIDDPAKAELDFNDKKRLEGLIRV